MSWEGDRWRRMREEVRRQHVEQYGEAVVKEWEDRCARWPLEMANYDNVKYLLFRDERDGAQPVGPPVCPTLQQVADEMAARKVASKSKGTKK